jgi:hypothetical protein
VFCGDKYETATTTKIYENEEDIKKCALSCKIEGGKRGTRTSRLIFIFANLFFFFIEKTILIEIYSFSLRFVIVENF